jgi:hypothetical protein
MSTNIQWQGFKLTEVDRAKIKFITLWLTISTIYKNTLFIALNEKLRKKVVA